jgi:hypothetical protein
VFAKQSGLAGLTMSRIHRPGDATWGSRLVFSLLATRVLNDA